MKIDIDDNQIMLQLESEYPLEVDIVRSKLIREAPNGWMLKKKVGDFVNTQRVFIDEFNCVLSGLWLEIIRICREANISVTLTDRMKAFIGSFNLDRTEFEKVMDIWFEGALDPDGNEFKPYGYQVDGAYHMLKYRKCVGELCTAAGKTLTSYLMFRYMYKILGIKRILYVVPSVDLAKQSISDYETYESFLTESQVDYSWTSGVMYTPMKAADKRKIKNGVNILFATYQSLAKKPYDFFKDFEVCIIDEAHHASAKSIIDIILKSENLKYCIGMTGTFPKEEHMDYLTIQSYVGPVVYRFTTEELIHVEKKGTPVYINTHIIDWASLDEKKLLYMSRKNKNPEDPNAGAKCLKEEQLFVNNSYVRLKYISDIAIKVKKNTLVLFGDIKYGYGMRIYNYIKTYSDKNVYYVDGNTDPKMREAMKQAMEADLEGNSVMVASIGTMGEGINMKNLWLILLVNTAKSNRLVRQIVGRGLRQFKGKDKVVMIDVVDDLRYHDPNYKELDKKPPTDNYMWKHYKERKNIYAEQKFPVIEQTVSLNGGVSTNSLF